MNSVTGEDERLEEILPLVAKHGAAVIGLANDETGIPETPQQRLEIATKIVTVAGDHGIPPEDVVIDPLAMTVGADTEAVTTTLETIRLIRDKLGVNMCLGASNVSFGLPRAARAQRRLPADGDGRGADQRDHEHRAEVCVDSVRAADLLLGHDAVGRAAGSPRTARARRGGGRAAVTPIERCRRRPTAPSAPALRFEPDGAEVRVPARHADVRRRELERHRDRLHLRRPRHVQEVQGAGASRASVPISPVDPRAFTPDELRDGWRLACRAPARGDLVIEVPPLQTRPKAALVGVGRHVILRPAVQKRHLVLEEPSLEDQRSDLAARAWTRSTTSSRASSCRCCARSARCCASATSTSRRSSATTC